MRRRVGALLVVGLGLVGCADPCEDLQLQCNRCLDPNHRQACEETVDVRDDEICEVALDAYVKVCD